MSKKEYTSQEEFERLNSEFNKVRLEAWGKPSELTYKNGVIYWSKTEFSKDKLINMIQYMKERNELYSKVMDSAKEFYEKSMRIKSLCTEYGFVADGKTYLPYWVDICDKIKIDSSMMKNNPKKLKDSLDFMSSIRDYYKEILEVYMFMPISRSGHYQETKEQIIECSGGRDKIKEQDNLSEEELDFYLNLNEERHQHFKKYLVFETNENVEMYDSDEFGGSVIVDGIQCFTSDCGFGLRPKSKYNNSQNIESLLPPLEYDGNKADNIYLYFL
jgi:hypothetical protein